MTLYKIVETRAVALDISKLFDWPSSLWYLLPDNLIVLDKLSNEDHVECPLLDHFTLMRECPCFCP